MVDATSGSGQYAQLLKSNTVAVDVSGYNSQGSTSIILRPTVRATTQYMCLTIHVAALPLQSVLLRTCLSVSLD